MMKINLKVLRIRDLTLIKDKTWKKMLSKTKIMKMANKRKKKKKKNKSKNKNRNKRKKEVKNRENKSMKSENKC